MKKSLPMVAFLAIALAVAPILFSYKAEAAGADKHVEGSGTGAVTCPNGTTVNSQISFSGDKLKGFTGGFFQISTETGVKTGILQAKTLNQNHYQLSGIEESDSVCNTSIPSTVTISGNCGQGTINFVSSNGQRGTFSGFAACI